MDHCLNCGGAIGEPGKAYGYAGKWCHCAINPFYLYQRPSKFDSHLDASKLAIFIMGYDIEELHRIVAFAKAHGYESTPSPKERE